jgi:diguanylate cyclase (GGDEF)-like protein
MINIDGFKVINDRFGEQLGIEVLRKVAIISSNLVRRSHCHEMASFGRFGGEQFLALLPEVNNEQARNLAEQIRLSIEKFHWQLNTSDTLETEHKLTPITVSISISTYGHADHNTFQQLINWADNTLYQENNTTENKVLF